MPAKNEVRLIREKFRVYRRRKNVADTNVRRCDVHGRTDTAVLPEDGRNFENLRVDTGPYDIETMH